MPSDVISGAIIGIAALIITATLVATLFPQVFGMAGSITSIASDTNQRVRTSATVVNYYLAAPGELQFDVLNNGNAALGPETINMTVAYLNNYTMPAGLLARDVAPDDPYWTYAIEGTDNVWGQGDVMTITVISPAYDFAPGDYQLQLLLYNGAMVKYSFTI